jgi:DNA-binding response OmpR family regulator
MGKILYVEDEPDTAEAVKLILEVIGHEVDTAGTGTSGLDLIKKNSYDLILLDIMLPDMSGWEIYNQIKGSKRSVAFLSALPVSTERLAELKKSGIKDYITKPFTKKDLTERVQKILK